MDSSHFVAASRMAGTQPTKKGSQLGKLSAKENRKPTVEEDFLFFFPMARGEWKRTVYRNYTHCLWYVNTLLFCLLTPSSLFHTHTHFKSIAPHSIPASATSKGCPIHIVAWGVKHFRVHAQADTLVRWKRLSFHTLPVLKLFPAKP